MARNCFIGWVGVFGGVSWGGLWLVLMMLSLTQCGKKEEGAGAVDGEGRKKVMIIADRFDTPFRNYQSQLLISMVRTRAGVEVNAVEVMGKAEVQAQQVKEAVEVGTELLVVFPLLSSEVEEALREAVGKGVRVLVLGEDLPKDCYTAMVKVEGEEMGRVAGRLVVQALGEKSRGEGFTDVRGRVVQLRGGEGESGLMSEKMAQGFEEILQQEAGVKLVHDAPGDWNVEAAEARMREALRLQQPFDVVFAHNDLMAVGAARVAEEAGQRDRLLILGVDGAAGPMGGMELVRGEVIEATVYRPPLVDVAWELMVGWLEDEGVSWPKVTVVKPFLMTLEEAAKLEGKGLPKPVTEVLE